jgi:hypothetical protein
LNARLSVPRAKEIAVSAESIAPPADHGAEVASRVPSLSLGG